MSSLALIPARKNSRRLPGKNVRHLGGKPLIQWTIEAAKDSGCYDLILVCTDSDEAMVLANTLGVQYWKRKPVPDLQPDLEWVVPAVDRYAGVDVFSILRPTSPFRSAATIRRAFARWREVEGKVDSLRAVRLVSEHPGKMWMQVGPDVALTDLWWAWTGHHDPNQSWNLPSQAASSYPIYIQTGGLEIAHRIILPDSISGRVVAPFILDGPEALDINSEQDWWVAQRMIQERLGVTSP